MILTFWGFISFHFGLLGLYFLSFWLFGFSFPFILGFGLSCPFILAFWAFISFHFGLLDFHLLLFWPFGPLFLFIFAFWGFISFHFLLAWAATWAPLHKLPKTARFLMKSNFLSAETSCIFNFKPFWLSFTFILAFWAFNSFHFGLLGLYFLSFWPFGLSFPFILIFLVFISFHFGFLGFHFFFWLFGLSFPSFLACLGCHVGSPPQVAKNGPFPNEI